LGGRVPTHYQVKLQLMLRLSWAVTTVSLVVVSYSIIVQKYNVFRLFGLKVIFHFVAHSEILIRSIFNISAFSVGSEPVANNEVSSAKLRCHFICQLYCHSFKL
jgi:hypothetical protein